MTDRLPGGFEDGTFYSPYRDGSVIDGALDAGEQIDAPETFMPDDYDIVSSRIEEFMYALYGTDRYARHNDRILAYHARYSGREDLVEVDPETATIDKMAIILHDFVEHAILRPERTAAKLGSRHDADRIKDGALSTFSELLDAVDDRSGLIKAFLFAIDTSKWESEARKWRVGATDRIDDMVAGGEISEDNAAVLRAAINKTIELDEIDDQELEGVLRRPEHYLADLKLEAISEGTLNHNIKGLYFKALETLDLITHPPADNPASTYRDCTEAINFFVPALMALGYKRLAMDLRDSSLQWFFDDPNLDAQSQHAVSQVYFGDIKDRAIGLLESQFGGVEAEIEARVKSVGSLREKLSTEGYKWIRVTADGVGLAFIVPDEMAGEEMTLFAEEYAKKLAADPSIGPAHPKGSAFENMQGDRRRKSGYEAIHMTFNYYPVHNFPMVSPLGHKVPFEIQVLTQEQYRLKMYGRYSDLFYKAGTTRHAEYVSGHQQYLDHLEERARAEREIAPGSTVQSIAEMVALSPEIPSVFNDLYRAVDTENGARILVPPELEDIMRRLPAEALGAAGELTVLPASRVTEAQFLEAISMFGMELATDTNIRNALALVNETEAGTVRDDGSTTVMEGHILPTALSAVVLAIQSGRIWGAELSPIAHISNVATIALLHDYVEKQLEVIDGKDAKTATRQMMLLEVKQMFGQTIMNGVDSLTTLPEIENETKRRSQYAKNIRANEYAMLIKPADRWQNHLSDIIKLAAATDRSSAPSAENEKQFNKIMRYFAKTDRHLSETFRSSELPGLYSRTHDTVWELAKYFGYKKPRRRGRRGRRSAG